jgi:hypothetical protein
LFLEKKEEEEAKKKEDGIFPTDPSLAVEFQPGCDQSINGATTGTCAGALEDQSCPGQPQSSENSCKAESLSHIVNHRSTTVLILHEQQLLYFMLLLVS